MIVSDLFSLKGKTAIVTGGLGQLGTQYVKSLLEAGAKVAVFDVKVDKLNSFFQANKENQFLKIYQVDITDKKSISEGLTRVMRDLGVPTILVNNAALDAPPNAPASENGPFEDFPG